MKRYYFLPIVVIVGLIISSCQPPLVSERNYKNYDYTLVTADSNYSYTMPQLYEALSFSRNLKNGGVLDTNQVRNFLDSLICDSLIGFDADTIRIEEYYDKYRQFKLRHYDFLIKDYLDEKIYSQVKFDSSDVIEYYNSNPDIFRVKETVEVSHILISALGLKESKDSLIYKSMTDDQFDSAFSTYTKQVYSEINSPDDFVQAAKKYSHDRKTSTVGGYVGWIKKGELIDPFDSVAFVLRSEDISKPYKNDQGWHILYVKNYFPEGFLPIDAHESFYAAAAQHYQTTEINKLGRSLFDSLRSELKIEYNEEMLDKDIFVVNGQTWIAIVNGIDSIDCNEAKNIELKVRQDLKVPNTTPEMKKEYLKRVAEKYMAVQAARNIGINKKPEAVANAASLRHKYARMVIYPNLYQATWTPPESLLKAYYEEHLDQFRSDKPMVVQHIVVEDSVFGEFLRGQATSGIDFMDLAMEHYPGELSVRKELADLGAISETDVPKEFYEAARITGVGEISHPVKTEYGYHIIKVIANNQPIELAQASNSIVPILKAKNRRESFEKYRDDAYLRYNVKFVGKMNRIHLRPSNLRK